MYFWAEDKVGRMGGKAIIFFIQKNDCMNGDGWFK